MCGILGQISFINEIDIDLVRFNKSLNLMEHRGPDAFGTFVGDKFIFGHRRLSIIDLSKKANQPMISDDKNIIITFNGEIYNYKELRRDLLNKGYVFKSNSDTEILIHGYHNYGIDFIHKCIGMFAFAIYDNRTNQTFIVRDRLGIKPLYYMSYKNNLVFSSEIKSILSLTRVKREINYQAISSYLSFRYPILNDTFFNNIYAVPPGNYIHLKGDQYNIVKYWDASDYYGHEDDYGEEYYVNQLRELLLSSVKYRMISDVPIGSYLSGGLDSSIITAIMAEESNDPLKTFNIGYNEDGYNEFEYSRPFSKSYNTNHCEILGDKDTYINDMIKLIQYKDAPLSIPNEVSLYNLSMELKKQITVALCGTGADELFYGYGRIFRSTYDYQRIKDKNFAANKSDYNKFLINYKKKYGDENFDNEIDHFYFLYNYTNINQKKNLLSDELSLEKYEKKYLQRFKKVFNKPNTKHYLDKMSYAFINIHLPGILYHDDTASMASSVELRVPFLDHRIVEFAISIPNKYKLKWISNNHKKRSKSIISDDISEKYDITKHVLRQGFKEKIPNEILNRKKLGFAIPIHQWVENDFYDFIKDTLLSSKSKNRNIYNVKYLNDILSNKNWINNNHHFKSTGDSRSYQYNLGSKIWMLLNIELFLSHYFDNKL